jgi:Trm5-related predicted tRNA methylase
MKSHDNYKIQPVLLCVRTYKKPRHYIVTRFSVTSQERFELPTDGLEGRCSILLSYWDMERVMGIEPTLSAWKAEVLPLNYTRMFFT